MFSIYEGIHKYHNPEPIHDVAWGIGVLLFAILLEGYATFSNIVELNKRRGKNGFLSYLRITKDSDLIVIFGENAAAVIGLIIATIALLVSYYTGDSRYDALGSLAIGVVLILVAIFLSVEVKSLLIGESADPIIIQSIETITKKDSAILEILNCRTIQQGPGEVLVCIKLKVRSDLTAQSISVLINNFEQELRTIHPEVKYIYVEPDLQEWKY
jgi:divalent metal cation (Fe/Co/Zn/Cd) transporter